VPHVPETPGDNGHGTHGTLGTVYVTRHGNNGDKPDYPCPVCGSKNWWQRDGEWVCGKCHPDPHGEFMFKLNMVGEGSPPPPGTREGFREISHS
jgi:hypothetical protein